MTLSEEKINLLAGYSPLVLHNFEDICEKIYNTNTNAVGSYLKLLDQTIAKEATCEILIPLYTKNFDETDELFQTFQLPMGL